MNSSIAASTIAARRSAARVARLDAGMASLPARELAFASERAAGGVAALVGFLVIRNI
ncbi:hypothetical protein [Bradyrhizobium sp. WSM471]|uniref:hypothetical protein n=1 Tax=Bradyrhizobium sp. WSM471 TaxID=319017 RepID=UPI001E4235CD|nr:MULTISPECIES: hypothetical protein [Bradyrhizobium]UFW45152.1 hypothetical protein BcanWSM471_25040 [Bradyrhizobium canariense]